MEIISICIFPIVTIAWIIYDNKRSKKLLKNKKLELDIKFTQEEVDYYETLISYAENKIIEINKLNYPTKEVDINFEKQQIAITKEKLELAKERLISFKSRIN